MVKSKSEFIFITTLHGKSRLQKGDFVEVKLRIYINTIRDSDSTAVVFVLDILSNTNIKRKYVNTFWKSYFHVL